MSPTTNDAPASTATTVAPAAIPLELSTNDTLSLKYAFEDAHTDTCREFPKAPPHLAMNFPTVPAAPPDLYVLM